MHPTLLRALALLLIVGGEAAAILAEVLATHRDARDHAFSWRAFWSYAPLVTLGGAMLLVGYMLGYRSYRNIWVVGVISVVSILILEPLITYTVFRELPTRGAAVGFGFGLLGFVATLVL